jgi:hypothetical protein
MEKIDYPDEQATIDEPPEHADPAGHAVSEVAPAFGQ